MAAISVGVMGSSGNSFPAHAKEKAYEMGGVIAKRGYILMTGGGDGLPYFSSEGAFLNGGLSIGISPGCNVREHVKYYKLPTEYFTSIIFTGMGFMGRESINIQSSDVVIFLAGRSGTLGEFATAYDDGKVLGVLSGIGGIAQHFRQMIPIIEKDTGAVIIEDEDPERLVDRVVAEYLKHRDAEKV